MKKNIIAIAVVVCLSITAFAGASLAYFTDSSDAKVNAFTVGHVDIELLEQQRGENGLEDFENNKPLYPLVGKIQTEEVDEYGMTTNPNYVDKIVNVTNTGKSDAYVRVIVAFPADFDAEKASDMMLHWNSSRLEAGETDPSKCWTRAGGTEQVTIGGVLYNLYVMTYNGVLTPGEQTKYPAIVGVYLDPKVDSKANADGSITYFMGNQEATVAEGGTVDIHVIAQGIQVEGFENAAEALEAGFGAITSTNNPWATATN